MLREERGNYFEIKGEIRGRGEGKQGGGECLMTGLEGWIWPALHNGEIVLESFIKKKLIIYLLCACEVLSIFLRNVEKMCNWEKNKIKEKKNPLDLAYLQK